MTYVLELTGDELSNLTVELECLIAEYEVKAKKAREISSGCEEYYNRFADRLRRSLEKVKSAKARRD